MFWIFIIASNVASEEQLTITKASQQFGMQQLGFAACKAVFDEAGLTHPQIATLAKGGSLTTDREAKVVNLFGIMQLILDGSGSESFQDRVAFLALKRRYESYGPSARKVKLDLEPEEMQNMIRACAELGIDFIIGRTIFQTAGLTEEVVATGIFPETKRQEIQYLQDTMLRLLGEPNGGIITQEDWRILNNSKNLSEEEMRVLKLRRFYTLFSDSSPIRPSRNQVGV